jgi:nucleotide-binding universal stress UspA family protein
VDVDEFCAVVAVADARHGGRAAELAARLAAVGNLPLTVLECRGAEVVEHTAGRDGAIIVLEAFGGGPPGDRLFDADAEVVLTRLRHPVLVLGPEARVPTTIPTPVVALDAGGASTAVDAAARWHVTFRSGQPVVVALDPPDPWPDEGHAPVHDPARRVVVALARRGVEASLVRRVALDPAAAVLESAELVEEPVLVVAAPRWPGGPSHWYSTARRLIRHAHCPVLVAPANADL